MLHIRYDWRRPVFWAAVCLTFFLSSQTTSNGNIITHSIELGKKKNTDPANKGFELRPYESNFSHYLYIAKK